MKMTLCHVKLTSHHTRVDDAGAIREISWFFFHPKVIEFIDEWIGGIDQGSELFLISEDALEVVGIAFEGFYAFTFCESIF